MWACDGESRRGWEQSLVVIFFLMVRGDGGVDDTNAIERYLPVLLETPALFVLIVWYGRRCIRGGIVEAGIFHGGLR